MQVSAASPPPPESYPLTALDLAGANLLRGAFAYGGRQVAMTVLGLATNLILTRLLVPEDFGQIAALMVVAGLARVLSVGGIGIYLVQQSGSVSDEELSAVRAVQLVIYACLQGAAVVLAVIAPLVEMDATLWWMMALIVFAVAFGVLRSGSAVLLERRMAFGTIARIEVGEQLANTTIVIGLAAAGAGAWSVAIAVVVASVLAWLMSARAAPFHFQPHWPRLTAAFRQGLRFSAAMIAPNVIGALRLAALPVVVGGLAGMYAAGLAERALFVAAIPFALLGGIQQRILFTFTARIQHDRLAVRRVLQEATYISAVADKILYLPLVAFGPAVISVLFSDRWVPIAPTMEVIAWSCAAFGSFFSCAGPVLTGLGRARVMLVTNLLMLIVTWVFILPLTTRFGTLGYGYVQLLLWTSAPYLFVQARREIGSFDLVQTCIIPFAAFTIAVLVVRQVAGWWAPTLTLPALIVFSLLGITVYLACLAAIGRRRLFRLARYLGRSIPMTVNYHAARP